ncbi:hypothetical protein HPB49_013461 [Dermacentor silvarum]|uniref:Uncharacterized protein n=1 Tax=Dermacentor silvarum TaxID=543639 RepID=A0ACB8E0P1_DERSI|nr:hypothetical protein HPB49_013461 [Dermacentor silvarum]
MASKTADEAASAAAAEADACGDDARNRQYGDPWDMDPAAVALRLLRAEDNRKSPHSGTRHPCRKGGAIHQRGGPPARLRGGVRLTSQAARTRPGTGPNGAEPCPTHSWAAAAAACRPPPPGAVLVLVFRSFTCTVPQGRHHGAAFTAGCLLPGATTAPGEQSAAFRCLPVFSCNQPQHLVVPAAVAVGILQARFLLSEILIWRPGERQRPVTRAIYYHGLLFSRTPLLHLSVLSLLSVASMQVSRYQAAHIRTRNTVEKAFGVWKRRFPCLDMGLQHSAERSAVVTTACAALYNLTVLRQDPDPPAVVIPQHLRRQQPDVASQTDTLHGSQCRMRLIAQAFH